MKTLQRNVSWKFEVLLVATALLGILTASALSISENPKPFASQTQTQEGDRSVPQDQNQKTFTGVITKAEDKYVLVDSATKNKYQLLFDDAQKAQEMLNKRVRITGILDSSTGTIRVMAIDPA